MKFSNQPPDNALFVKLFMEHQQHLKHYIYSLVHNEQDAADILQTSAVLVWQKFQDYDPERPFFSWACRFAYYEAMNFRQKKKVRERYLSDAVLELIAAEWPKEDKWVDHRDALKKCLCKLSERDRKIVELRYESGQKISDAAGQLKMSAKQIYKALERIRDRLRRCVELRAKSSLVTG